MESSTDVVAGLGALVFLAFALLIGLACFAFWIWMLVHAIQNKGLSDTERIVWVLVIIFVQVIGPIIYFLVGKPKAGRPPPI